MTERPSGRIVPLVAIAVVLVGFAVRLFSFVNQHAISVLFWDQWGFLGPLFDHRGWWTMFHYQHGPHRQGVGGLLIALVYPLSGWNGRAEAFVAAVLMIGTTLLCLWIVRLAFGRWSLWDVCIPLLVLTTVDFEIFAGTTNLAHGPMPVFLIALFVLCAFIERPWVRTATMGVSLFCAVFTGFGVLLGLVAPCVYLLQLRDAEQRRPAAVGLILWALTMVAFGKGYVFEPAAACFKFPDPNPSGYLTFFGWLVARPLSIFGDSLAGRLALYFAALLLLVVAALAMFKFLRAPKDARSRTIFILAAFSVVFGASTAVGRLCLGVGLAVTPRYVPYMLLGWVAIYFWLRDLAERLPAMRVLPAAFLVLCVAKNFFPDIRMTSQIAWYTEGKRKWISCYREHHDIETCDRVANFQIFPDPKDKHFRERLDYLEQNHLSLFR